MTISIFKKYYITISIHKRIDPFENDKPLKKGQEIELAKDIVIFREKYPDASPVGNIQWTAGWKVPLIKYWREKYKWSLAYCVSLINKYQ